MKERLRQLRGNRSQTQVEIQTGVRQRTLSGWENNPPEYFRHLIKLAQYYKVSTDYILGLTNHPWPLNEQNIIAEGRPRYIANDENQAILQHWAQLNDADRQAILHILRSLTQEP